MGKHETKHCPRCNTPFECRVGSIFICQCMTVEMSNEERNYIYYLYNDCLCAECIRVLKAEYADINTTYRNEYYRWTYLK